MRRRALQLAVLIVLGGAAGFLLTHDWNATKPAAAVSTLAVERSVPAVETPKKAADVSPPPARTFKLPAMPPPTPERVAAEPAIVPVPRFWLLRGTGAQNYDLLSDSSNVMSGRKSVLIRSHRKDISATLTGSVMQSAAAESLLGKRIEVSAYLSVDERVRERTVKLWFTALDSKNLLLATGDSSRQFPKIAGEWTRVHFVIDVPWGTAQAEYGVTLRGPGAVWMDDVRLTPVDATVVAVTNEALPRQLGQRVEVANTEGPIPRPENLDFEETTEVAAPPREGENLSAVRR